MRFSVVILLLAAVAAAIFFLAQLNVNPQPPAGFSNTELAGNSQSIGPKDANVVIVEFSDYQCPACLTAEQSIRLVLPQFEGKVLFVYRNYPLTSIHPNAPIAAEAALAAGGQGKFWEMHNALFDNQELIRAQGFPAILQIAQNLGLDMNKFNDEMAARKFAPAAKKDLDDAIKFGCQGTPTFFINGKKYFEALSPEQLTQIIRENLAGSAAK